MEGRWVLNPFRVQLWTDQRIYHYTLRGPQGTIGSGKLAVER